MLRQIANLRRFGRIRSSSPTPRRGKPRFLKRNPKCELEVLPMVLASLGRAHDEFFFVQIGAFDGVSGDPLNQLIRRHHWRGVLVEPQGLAFKLLQETYRDEPQLKLLNVAIGAEDGELTLYSRIDEAVSIASTHRQLLIKPSEPASTVLEERVTCWTPQTLFREAGVPEPLDLLQIDTEGHDLTILKSLDLSRHRPRVIRYEHTILCQKDRDTCLEMLADHGYRFILEDKDTTAVLADAG
ncbi:MAG: FkbM family methyltransferase [Planctomycetales bacterium]|nr:FkbM family methyltransferase [Planctomycetales bacterium]